jgi:hypothetical protein
MEYVAGISMGYWETPTSGVIKQPLGRWDIDFSVFSS